jgi:hypothetical protein
MGVKSEMKYNPVGFVTKVAVATVCVTAVYRAVAATAQVEASLAAA